MRVKLYPLERYVGSRQCKKRRCKVYANVTETDTFSSTVTGETFQIKHELNGDDKCLIYLFKCKVCYKHYVGETTDAFRLRWNNYKNNDKKFQRNESYMQQHLYERSFTAKVNGFLRNVSISLIDKTDGHDFEFILFCLYITPAITLYASFRGFSIDLLCELFDWFLNDLDALIEVYSSYLIYILFILFIYLFALCYIYFCLLILLILLFVVVDVVVVYSFFNSSYCSCFGFSIYFTFLSLVGTLLFMLALCIGALLSFVIVVLYLFLFLFSLFTHYISKSYCSRYLYDLPSVLLVWLLTLLVYIFPYGDFIVN